MLGFLLDAMDVSLYLFALQSIRNEFGLSLAQAGLVTTCTLLASAAGGVLCGLLSDRIGRTRTLIFTILLYSLASGGSATAQGLGSLVFWRSLVGLGLGGEWSAGSVLVAESWPPQHRAKAISFMQSGWALGYLLAAALSAFVLPRFGWRVLFLIGVLPALLTLAIRRYVPESKLWTQTPRSSSKWVVRALASDPTLRSRLAISTAVATTVLIAYWGLFSWAPSFLSASKELGGAGLGLLRSSLWLIVIQSGAYAGYLVFGVLADRFGRKPTFSFYVVVAAALTLIFGWLPGWSARDSELWLWWLGPSLGFFGTGYFSLFGAMLAELFPTKVRATAQGFAYNIGRACSALAPYAIGAWAERAGLGTALTLCSVFFLLAGLLVWMLPETRSAELD